MNTPESFSSNKNIILQNWDNLEESQKNILLKIWKIITYKWQLQILLNIPFLVWWLLDQKVEQIHTFDIKLISYLNIPEWALSLMGLSQSIN
tara:strand:- start:690 stop:965 length:276 start_codon:yes stop_codon:yes gene_type:complete